MSALFLPAVAAILNTRDPNESDLAHIHRTSAHAQVLLATLNLLVLLYEFPDFLDRLPARAYTTLLIFLVLAVVWIDDGDDKDSRHAQQESAVQTSDEPPPAAVSHGKIMADVSFPPPYPYLPPPCEILQPPEKYTEPPPAVVNHGKAMVGPFPHPHVTPASRYAPAIRAL
jgi:hypothetical protein